MAWETRNGRGRYYTRSRKVAGRVLREYVGVGLIAEQAAAVDAQRREERQARADERRSRAAYLQQFDAPINEFFDNTQMLANEALEAAGYYYRQGQWRRRYDRPGDDDH